MVLIIKTVLICYFPYLCVCLCIFVYVCVYVYLCMYMFVCLYLCMGVCAYVYVYMYLGIYVYWHMCLYVYVCVYMCMMYCVLCKCMVYVCICVYIYFLALEHWLSLLPSWTGRKCSFLTECSELWVFHRWLVLVRKVSCFTLISAFVMKGCWILLDTFSGYTRIIVEFFFLRIHWILAVKPISVFPW